MTRRFWIAVALTTPLLLIAMAAMFGYRLHLDLNLNGVPLNLPWLEFILATPVSFGPDGPSSSVSGLRSSVAAPTCSP